MRFLLALIAMGIFVSNSLHSAVTAYTDRTAWRNASGGDQVFYVDFNSYTTDVAGTAPVDVGPLTLTPNGDWSVIPMIDSLQGGFWNRSVDGTAGVTLYGRTSPISSLLVSFDSAVGSFGFDLADSFGTGSGIRRALITTSAGDSYQFVAHTGTIGFIGLVSTSAFNRVTFTSSDTVRPQMDNFEARAVPEPSAGALLLLGAGGVLALRRLRRKAD